MSMAIKQHWVPQFYLRAFATSKNGTTLFVTDIKRAYEGSYAHDKKKVGEVAQLSHLYSLPKDDGSFQPDKPNDEGWDDSVDRELQSLEADAGRIWAHLQKAPKDVDLSPASRERRTLARFLANLHLRHPRMAAVAKYADTFSTAHPPSTPQERDAFHRAVADTPINMAPTLEGVQDRAAFLVAQTEYLTDIEGALQKLHWTLRMFPGNGGVGPLVTSDTPLFCVDRKTMAPGSMEDPDCMVICPLTSRLLFIATAAPTSTANGEVTNGTNESAALMNRFIVHFGQLEAYSGFALTSDFPFLRDVSEANI